MGPFPWITIPPAAHPHQRHAFANRKDQLANLYRLLAEAGNAVRGGAVDVSLKVAVMGYVGVGKSALILQALRMLRHEHRDQPGQRLAVPDLLPEPEDIQRWLMLRVSGKYVGDVMALADSFRQSIAAEGAADTDGLQRVDQDGLTEKIAGEIHTQAKHGAPAILELPILHRLFKRREASLYKTVEKALASLADELDEFRTFGGGKRTDRMKRTRQAESAHDAKVRAEAGAHGQLGGGALKGGLDASAGASRKLETAQSTLTELEHQSRVTSERLVAALNNFFDATRAAHLPTILVIDDFDEVTSFVGASHENRASILASILGPFTQLRPSVLVLGLRQEYKTEDIRRQYAIINVPPMSRRDAGLAIEAWAEVQEPAVPAPLVEALKALADRFLAPFAPTAPVVIPFSFLQMAAWIANNRGDTEMPAHELLVQYLDQQFERQTVRLITRIAAKMKALGDDMHLCAEATALDPEPYALLTRDVTQLVKEGLLRPALADDPTDTRMIFDPLCGYLAAAMQ